MSNNTRKIVFQAYLVQENGKNKLMFDINSNHIPTLDHIYNELGYEIIELRALEKMKKEAEKEGKIVNLSNAGLITLKDFLRRGHRR